MFVSFAETTDPSVDTVAVDVEPTTPPLLLFTSEYSESTPGFVHPNIEKITECDVGTSRIEVKSNGELVICTIERTLLESLRNFSKFIRPSITVSHDSFKKYKSFWQIGKNGILKMFNYD